MPPGVPRILACVLCQQRKVKCDRQTPCSNCVKAQVECIPSTLQPRRRRRRFPESELLDRLRQYEDLLQKNGVSVEPLAGPAGSKSSPNDGHDGSDSDGDYEKVRKASTVEDKSSPAGTENSQEPGTKKTFWRAMNQEFKANRADSDYDSDQFEENAIQNAWDQMYANNDHILFGVGMEPKNITAIHPDPVHIFRLWHVYMDNVNPILKITHSPTLQPRIIEASSNLGAVSPGLEALMFAIYSSAIMSLTEEECHSIFNQDREVLAVKYRNGCQQALINAGFLRTHDAQVAIAYTLYLFSIRQNLDPRSLASMIGIAVRVAQRMGMHSEAHNKEHSIFDAEMRRRLWWQLVLFDARIGEISGGKESAWDCALPLNVNDGDLYPHLKEPPTPREGPTECIFILVRCEIADFIRNAPVFIELVSPFLKPLARPIAPGAPKTIDELEDAIETKYFKQADMQIPLNFISSCAYKAYIGKWRLGEAIVPATTALDLDSRIKVFENAIYMIELDSISQSCQTTKGFIWFSHFHFPFPAYVFLVQELRRSTMGPLVDRAWEALAANFKERHMMFMFKLSKLYQLISGMLIKAWEAREDALEKAGLLINEPDFIVDIRKNLGKQRKERKVDEQLLGLSLTTPVEDPNLALGAGMGMTSGMFAAGGQGMGFNDLGMDMGMGALGGDQMGFWNMDFDMLDDFGAGNAMFPGMQDMGTGAGTGTGTWGTW